MKRWTIRILTTLLGLVACLAIIVWLVWIPSPEAPPYEFVRAWGGPGTEPGLFQDPTGIAVTADEVFVSDSRNGRIQVFTHKGEFLRMIGSPDRLGRPMNLAIRGDRLYVADYWHDRISMFSLQGEFIRHIGEAGTAPGRFRSPGGVAVAADESLYVADFYNQRVQHLGRDGQSIDQWGTTGEIGIAAGEFRYPTDVAFNANGQLLVADGYNDRIQVFDASGKFVHKWGGPMAMNISGPFPGWFSTVTSVAVGPQGNVFVADFHNHRIQKFTIGGQFLTRFGSEGDGPGEFRHPMAVDVAPDGRVFTADFDNNRILVWQPARRTGGR